jgi:hypothetical protein
MSLAALKRPFSVRSLPGLLLALVPIIEFFAMGYKMACARTAMSGNYELPRWKNVKQLFIFGAVARLIQLIWLLPAAIVFAQLFFKLKATIAVPSSLQTFQSIGSSLMWFAFLLVIAAIFMPACVMNYVAEAKFTAAFSFSTLKRMLSKEYLFGWLLASLYTIIIVAALFGTFLMLGTSFQTLPSLVVTLIAFLLELIVFWLPGITIWTLLGEAWGKAIAAKQ